MGKSKSRPAAGGPMSKPRRARDELSEDFPSKPRRVRDRLTADFTDRVLEVAGCSHNFDPIRFYLRTDYNQELDFFGPSVAVLLEVEFGLTRGEVVALSAADLDYLLGQAHRCKGAPTPDDRRRVLAEVAELRTKLANLPNPSPGEAALLKALDRFPEPQADEEMIRIGRLEIDPLSKTIRLGEKTATIEHVPSFEAFLLIAQARGARVGPEEIRAIPGCRGRFDQRLKKHLPPWVLALIPAQRGRLGGRALLLPETRAD
jgi:hypothetical protein